MKVNYFNPNYSNLEQYIVKQGDSLYTIAKMYGVTVEDLKNTNHLAVNMIYPNQILFIPKSHNYKTQNNESISDIITKYNLTLKDISNLKLMPNQIISRDVKYYTITADDCVEDILSKSGLSPLELLKLNEKKFIVTGEKIIIEK